MLRPLPPPLSVSAVLCKSKACLTPHIPPPILRIQLHRLAGIGKISLCGLHLQTRIKRPVIKPGEDCAGSSIQISILQPYTVSNDEIVADVYKCLASRNSPLVAVLNPAYR